MRAFGSVMVVYSGVLRIAGAKIFMFIFDPFRDVSSCTCGYS